MPELMTAIGLMSGTSMDGIDVALLRTDGEHVVERGPALGLPYDAAFRRVLAVALETARAIQRRDERPGNLGEIEADLTRRHAAAVDAFLSRNGVSSREVGALGFHGQTVLHRPLDGLTVQLGDGPMLAAQTGLRVVYDMRANDMAHGGQGAPLVPAYHAALAAGVEGFAGRPILFANIGGISNLTFIGSDGALLAYDSGPGNTMIDQWVEANAGIAYDAGGAIASEGTIVPWLAERYLGHPFFQSAARLSLDRNDFRPPEEDEIGLHDGARTLAHVSAAAIVRSMRHLPERPALVIVCGGGRLNRVIMADLAALLSEVSVEPAETFGLNGDSMEAEAWAYLAVRALRGLPLTFPGTTGVRAPVSGGVIVPAPVLVTERLALLPWTVADAPALAALHGTPDAARFVGAGTAWTRDYAEMRIEGWMSDLGRHGITKYKIVARDDGRFVGRAGFSLMEEHGVFELGYAIREDAWGQGLASEVADGLARWFFETRPENRFVAFAIAENLASIRVMEKIGMREIEPRDIPRGRARFFEMRRGS